MRPSSTLRSTGTRSRSPANFKRPDPRTSSDERPARSQEGPEGHLEIESKLKSPVAIRSTADKQPLPRSDLVPLQLHRHEHRAGPGKSLADANLTSSSPVDIHVTNIRMEYALKLILQPLGLTYKVENEVLVITSPQVLLVHVSQDVLRRIPSMPPGRKANLYGLTNIPLGSTNDPAAPQSGRWPRSPRPRPPQTTPACRPAAGEKLNCDMGPLVQLISTSIAPGSWAAV